MNFLENIFKPKEPARAAPTPAAKPAAAKPPAAKPSPAKPAAAEKTVEPPTIPVLFKAVQDNKLEVVQQLIAGKGDLELRFPVQELNGWNETPLILCALWGRVEACKLLIEAGANINAVDFSGHSALNSAALNGNLEVCKLLLKKKCDPNIRDQVGRSALDSAKIKKHKDNPKFAKYKEIITLLKPVTGPPPPEPKA